MSISLILDRLRALPLVTRAETDALPQSIASLFPEGSLTFRAVIDDPPKYGKAETYITPMVYEAPNAADFIADNISQLFSRMANGEEFVPSVDGPVLPQLPPPLIAQDTQIETE